MNLDRLQRVQDGVSLRSMLGVKIGLLVSLLLGTLGILFVIENMSSSSFAGAEWELNVFVLSIVAVPVIVISRMIVQQFQSALTRYTKFAENIGDDACPDLKVEQYNKELRNLGNALSDAHQRLQQQAASKLNTGQYARFSGMVEASPNIVLLMDSDGEVRYLNSRGRQVADAVGLAGEDVSVILPFTPSALISRCIHNNEILKEQEVSYRDRKFVWTVLPLHGEKMLQAHGSVISRRRKIDYHKPFTASATSQPRLYSIAKHPDYQRYRGSILVIDADELMQGLMARYFQKDGYRVISASNGEMGLEMAGQHKPELITLDIMMPGKNGWMVLSALKDNPELANIPVVVVSNVGNKRFVHAMGADDYVSKPVDWGMLGKTVKRLSGECHETGALQ